MTETQRKERRIGWISIVAVLVFIGAFWSLYVIRHRPKKPRSTAELVEELKTFKVPQGAKNIYITPMQIKQPQTVVGVFSADSSCQTISSYYKQEFARHRFVFQPRDDEKPEAVQMSFCGHGTHGGFTCKPSDSAPQYYVVTLWWPGDSC